MKIVRTFVVGGVVSMLAAPALAEDWLRLLSGIALGSQVAMNATFLGGVSQKMGSATSRHFDKLNAEKRRELDNDIDATYQGDQAIIAAAQNADDKIKANKAMLAQKHVRQNEQMQAQIKRNINLWKRMKERAAEVVQSQRAVEAKRESQNNGLGLGG